jgi:hypothetical protein
MTYAKPEMFVLDSATTAIAHFGGSAKPEDVNDAIASLPQSSASAYEVDE